jgi:protein-S-isoprenylcysteine O-methyltransferase Ste14
VALAAVGLALFALGWVLVALALGSTAGALLAIVPALTFAARVVVEERLLREMLPSYEDYTKRVRWRLVPFVW